MPVYDCEIQQHGREVKLTEKRRKIFLIQREYEKREISQMDNIYVILRGIAIYASMKVLGLLEKPMYLFLLFYYY